MSAEMIMFDEMLLFVLIHWLIWFHFKLPLTVLLCFFSAGSFSCQLRSLKESHRNKPRVSSDPHPLIHRSMHFKYLICEIRKENIR